jgi:hypothetical protein
LQYFFLAKDIMSMWIQPLAAKALQHINQIKTLKFTHAHALRYRQAVKQRLFLRHRKLVTADTERTLQYFLCVYVCVCVCIRKAVLVLS